MYEFEIMNKKENSYLVSTGKTFREACEKENQRVWDCKCLSRNLIEEK